MTWAEAKVLLVLCAHVKTTNWTCYLSLERGMTLTGLTKQGFLNGRDRLVAKGHVRIDKGGGRGHATTYTVNTNSLPGLTVSDAQTVYETGLNSLRKGPKQSTGVDPNIGTEKRTEGKPASPAAAETPKKPKAEGKPTAAEHDDWTKSLVAAWIHGSNARGVPVVRRGKIAGLLLWLRKQFSPDMVLRAVRLWWGADRTDYGVELFKCKVEGGDKALTGRAAAGSIDAIVEAGSRNPTPEEVALFAGGAAGGAL